MQETATRGAAPDDDEPQHPADLEPLSWPHAPDRRGGAALRVSPVNRAELVRVLRADTGLTVHEVVDALGLPPRKLQRQVVSRELQLLRDAGRLVYQPSDRSWRLRRREERLRLVPELADVRLTVQQLDALVLYLERSHVTADGSADDLQAAEVASLREARNVLRAARSPYLRPGRPK